MAQTNFTVTEEKKVALDAGREPKSETLTWTVPDQLAEFLTNFGMTEGDAIAKLSAELKVNVAPSIRSMISDGKTKGEIQSYVDTWEPGAIRVAGPKGKAKVTKGMDEYLETLGITGDDKTKQIDKISAMLAKLEKDAEKAQG